jgi:hypothetical protein
MTEGHMRGLSPVSADGSERLEISIDRNHAGLLPYTDNQRVSVTLEIGDTRYNGGIEALQVVNMSGFSLISGITLGQGWVVSLARALTNNGFQKNQRVCLDVEGNTAKASPAP